MTHCSNLLILLNIQHDYHVAYRSFIVSSGRFSFPCSEQAVARREGRYSGNVDGRFITPHHPNPGANESPELRFLSSPPRGEKVLKNEPSRGITACLVWCSGPGLSDTQVKDSLVIRLVNRWWLDSNGTVLNVSFMTSLPTAAHLVFLIRGN